jgi:hypothetical protein
MADGTVLASRYAFPPNRRGYCGPGCFGGVLGRFLKGRAGMPALRAELASFPAHYAYLSLIAHANGMEPFDYEVVRAFWTGNRLLESVGPEDLPSFIRKDLFCGKQAARAERLCSRLPEGILPHHSFNSLFVNFVSNAVPRSIASYDSCCITSGRVVSVSENSVTLRRRAIVRADGGGFAVAEKSSRALLGGNGVLLAGGIRAGDTVSVHWGIVIEKLDGKNARLLEKYTLKNIRAINRSMKVSMHAHGSTSGRRSG